MMDSIAYRFPITTADDSLKITNSDNAISSSAPYDSILIRYMSQSFSRDVDTDVTPRNFDIVIDVGTHSGVDDVVASGGTTLTSAAGNISGLAYAGGTLYVHEGGSKGTYTISGTPTSTVVTITSTFPAADSGVSFTLQRSVPVTATAEQIYEKVQWYLRQNADIDSYSTTVTGKTATNGEAYASNVTFPTVPVGMVVDYLAFYKESGNQSQSQWQLVALTSPVFH